jgi:succinate-semialdehyde dehydrogenase / glutarate-semialdehyde dehydrogenase
VVVDPDTAGADLACRLQRPVLAVTTFTNDAQAMDIENRTEYGLVSYAYTKDDDRAHRLIDALETGTTGINTGLVSNASAAFGDVKQSGLGREGGIEGDLRVPRHEIHTHPELIYTPIMLLTPQR